MLERRDDPAGMLSFYIPSKRRYDHSRVRCDGRTTADRGLTKVDVVFAATTGRGVNAKTTFDLDSKLTIGAVKLRVKALRH